MPTLLLLFVLGASPPIAPADGLSLLPDPAPAYQPRPQPPPGPVAIPTDVPTPDRTRVAGTFRLLYLGMAAAVITAVQKLSRRPGVGGAGPLIVFVPGHGAAESGTFEGLIAAMGLVPGDYVEFDYRTLHPGSTHEAAARRARSGDIASGVANLINELGTDRPIYLVGHSKGGVAIAELVASWDGLGAAPPPVIGAALLDPPMAGGALGLLQSAGVFIDEVPSDGGYDPRRCTAWECHDTRHGLGLEAGIDVVVIRNPDALVTNFTDEPRDLRVFDLDDGGRHPLLLLPDVGKAVQRIHEAHESVLHHPEVAACIAAEIESHRGCRWPEPRWRVHHADQVKSVGGGSHVLVT